MRTTTLGLLPLRLGVIALLFLSLPTSNSFLPPSKLVPIQTAVPAQLQVVLETSSTTTTGLIINPSIGYNKALKQRSLMSMNVHPDAESKEEGCNTNDNNSSNSNNNEPSSTSMSIVKNFRTVTGFQNIYRCANTDSLGDLFDNEDENKSNNADTGDTNVGNTSRDESNGVNNNIKSPEYTILHDVGLILDLRSQSERNERKARQWMSCAPGGKFQSKTFDRDNKKTALSTISSFERTVYRIDVLSPTRLFDYLSKIWLSAYPTSLKAKYTFALAFDSNALHEIRMDILNEKGLKGLYEAIIETSQEELFASLKAIVEYYENVQQIIQEQTSTPTQIQTQKHGVVIHCVQGKDRTGIISMLCQSMLGISDEIIVADYHLSESLLNRNEGSAAATSATTKNNEGNSTRQRGKLNKSFFSGSPAEVMVSTLKLIRNKYGSVDGYLDSIGFDIHWRERFITATSVAAENAVKEQKYRKKDMEGMNNVLQSKL